jgi:hypothetical protein
MKKIVQVLSAAAAILFVQPLAYALADGIVDLGGSVLDSNAGLEWLDLDIPAPCPQDDIENGVEGCDFYSEGWMLASSDQVDEFLSNADVFENGFFPRASPAGQVAEELMLILGPTNVVLDPGEHWVTEIWGITSTAGTAPETQDTRAISIFDPVDGSDDFVRVYGDTADLDGNPVFQPDPPDDVVVSYWLVREARTIDIKPGSDPNGVNPKSKGVIPVAVLGSVDFDATQVDFSTVAFGPGEASPIHDDHVENGHVADVNGDFFDDMVLHFEVSETGIACGDTDATLTGETFGGDSVTGTDAVKTAGCK